MKIVHGDGGAEERQTIRGPCIIVTRVPLLSSTTTTQMTRGSIVHFEATTVLASDGDDELHQKVPKVY